MNYTVNEFLFGDKLVCKIDEILMQKKSDHGKHGKVR